MSSPQSAPRETYTEDRRRRQRRGRVVGFSVWVVLWALSVVPLAHHVGSGGATSYMIAAGVTLGIAAVLRGTYTKLRGLRFWSPWLFVLAVVMAIAGYLTQTAGSGGPIS
jgi:hypothetical protein